MRKILGGHLADLPRPLRRRWPKDKTPRHVSVKIYSWVGYSPGARHYYVGIAEEENPYWDKEEKGWRVCWDDPGAKGNTDHMEFLTYDKAKAWAEKVIKKRYTGKLWRVERDYSEEVERTNTGPFAYLRDGD
jgi:hypothetical protein